MLKNKIKQSGYTLIELVGGAFVFLLIPVLIYLFGCMFDWSVEWWITYLTGQTKNIPFWLSCIGGVVFNGVVFMLWVLTLIMSFAV